MKKLIVSKLIVEFCMLGLTSNAAAQSKQTQMLSCSPRILTSGSKLTLRFKLPHPVELAIVAPDGTWFFLVNEDPGQKFLVDTDSFRKLSRLELPVATAIARPFIYGREAEERIFQKPGVYQVILGENLETDADVPDYRCQVTLRLPARP
jgi:hypothetical protein